VLHPHDDVEGTEQGNSVGKLGVLVQLLQSAQQDRVPFAEQIMEPDPDAGWPTKRAPDHVVPDWDEAGALARQQLPGSNPADVVLGVQELLHLVGFPTVLHERPCAFGPEVDISRNPAESVTYLPPEIPLKQVDRNLNGD
jgi:hypothetical protein